MDGTPRNADGGNDSHSGGGNVGDGSGRRRSSQLPESLQRIGTKPHGPRNPQPQLSPSRGAQESADASASLRASSPTPASDASHGGVGTRNGRPEFSDSGFAPRSVPGSAGAPQLPPRRVSLSPHIAAAAIRPPPPPPPPPRRSTPAVFSTATEGSLLSPIISPSSAQLTLSPVDESLHPVLAGLLLEAPSAQPPASRASPPPVPMTLPLAPAPSSHTHPSAPLTSPQTTDLDTSIQDPVSETTEVSPINPPINPPITSNLRFLLLNNPSTASTPSRHTSSRPLSIQTHTDHPQKDNVMLSPVIETPIEQSMVLPSTHQQHQQQPRQPHNQNTDPPPLPPFRRLTTTPTTTSTNTPSKLTWTSSTASTSSSASSKRHSITSQSQSPATSTKNTRKNRSNTETVANRKQNMFTALFQPSVLNVPYGVVSVSGKNGDRMRSTGDLRNPINTVTTGSNRVDIGGGGNEAAMTMTTVSSPQTPASIISKRPPRLMLPKHTSTTSSSSSSSSAMHVIHASPTVHTASSTSPQSALMQQDNDHDPLKRVLMDALHMAEEAVRADHQHIYAHALERYLVVIRVLTELGVVAARDARRRRVGFSRPRRLRSGVGRLSSGGVRGARESVSVGGDSIGGSAVASTQISSSSDRHSANTDTINNIRHRISKTMVNTGFNVGDNTNSVAGDTENLVSDVDPVASRVMSQSVSTTQPSDPPQSFLSSSRLNRSQSQSKSRQQTENRRKSTQNTSIPIDQPHPVSSKQPTVISPSPVLSVLSSTSTTTATAVTTTNESSQSTFTAKTTSFSSAVSVSGTMVGLLSSTDAPDTSSQTRVDGTQTDTDTSGFALPPLPPPQSSSTSASRTNLFVSGTTASTLIPAAGILSASNSRFSMSVMQPIHTIPSSPIPFTISKKMTNECDGNTVIPFLTLDETRWIKAIRDQYIERVNTLVVMMSPGDVCGAMHAVSTAVSGMNASGGVDTRTVSNKSIRGRHSVGVDDSNHGTDTGDVSMSASVTNTMESIPFDVALMMSLRHDVTCGGDGGSICIDVLMRPLQLMQRLARTMTHTGGFITPCVNVPAGVWVQPGGIVPFIDTKCHVFHQLIVALSRLRSYQVSDPDLMNLSAFHRTIDAYEGAVDTARVVLVKKMKYLAGDGDGKSAGYAGFADALRKVDDDHGGGDDDDGVEPVSDVGQPSSLVSPLSPSSSSATVMPAAIGSGSSPSLSHQRHTQQQQVHSVSDSVSGGIVPGTGLPVQGHSDRDHDRGNAARDKLLLWSIKMQKSLGKIRAAAASASGRIDRGTSIMTGYGHDRVGNAAGGVSGTDGSGNASSDGGDNATTAVGVDAPPMNMSTGKSSTLVLYRDIMLRFLVESNLVFSVWVERVASDAVGTDPDSATSAFPIEGDGVDVNVETADHPVDVDPRDGFDGGGDVDVVSKKSTTVAHLASEQQDRDIPDAHVSGNDGTRTSSTNTTTDRDTAATTHTRPATPTTPATTTRRTSNRRIITDINQARQIRKKLKRIMGFYESVVCVVLVRDLFELLERFMRKIRKISYS